MLTAHSISIACLPAVAAWDGDADGVIDPLDLCPWDGAATTADLDLDWVGDACDPDADGDGIDDVLDPSPMDTDNDGLQNVDDDDDDADGVPDAIDGSPFDTDNDGLRNALDSDDDDDGYTDSDELSAGSDPLDPLHFPTSGTVVWSGAAGAKFAALQDISNPQDVPRAGPGAPGGLRFAPNGQSVVMLDGAPGATSRIEYAQLGGAAVAYETGVKLYGVDAVSSTPTALTEALVAHERVDDATQVDLSSLLVDAGGNFLPVVTVLTDIRSVDVFGTEVVFTAQPRGCSDCRAAYLVGVNGGVPQIVAPMVSNPSMIRYNGGVITLIGDASGGTGTAAWFGDVAFPMELRPPGAQEVTAAVGFGDGHVIATATSPEGDAMWLWNGTKARWHKLTDLSAPVSELDWSR